MPDRFLLPLLRGCGQMLFQPSARTGAVFLVLILSQSAGAFLMCLAGAAGATACGYLMERPGARYLEGESGFNGGLLGLLLSQVYEPGALMLVAGLAGGFATGLVRVALLRILPAPPFTAPFVVVAWLAFYLGGGPPAAAGSDGGSLSGGFLDGLLANAAQVLFMPGPWIGALVVLAVWLHSRRAATWVGAASLVAGLSAALFGLPGDLAASGLLGYNALILAAALQHRGTRPLLFVAGVAGSVWLSYLFIRAGVMPLSAPFVATAWLVIAAEAALARRSASV